MGHHHPNNARGEGYQQRPGPTVTNAQEEEQEVSEVQLFFDRECPERAIDRVGRSQVEVVQHEHVEQNVPQVKARDVNGSFVGEVNKIQRERGEVRRIQSPDASFPESEEANLRFVDARGACFRPEEMDTKPGDDEEKINAGKREVDYVTSDLGQPRLPTTERRLFRDAERVIRDDGQRRPAAHRVESKHAPDRSWLLVTAHRGMNDFKNTQWSCHRKTVLAASRFCLEYNRLCPKVR